MLGKLLKYDFRSMGKQFAFIWPAVLILALVNRLTLGTALVNNAERVGLLGSLASGLAFFLYWAIIMAMVVISLIFVIQRFFKGLLGDEGYLMHTLPAKPWQLIASKLICGIVTFEISILIAILSILIVIPFSAADMLDFWPALFDALGSQGIHGVLVPLELVLLEVIAMIQFCLHLYLSMAIGHLFGKHRIIMSVVAFLAINFIVNAIFSSAAFSLMYLAGDEITELIYGRMSLDVWGAWHAGIGLMILASAAASAVYFFFTERILRRHLNLE